MSILFIKHIKEFVKRDFFNKFNTLAVRAVWRSVPYTDITFLSCSGWREGGGVNYATYTAVWVTGTACIYIQFTYLCTLYTHIQKHSSLSTFHYIYFYVHCLVVRIFTRYFCFYSFLLPGGIQGEDADVMTSPCSSSSWTWSWLATARWTPPSLGRWRTSSTAYGNVNPLSLEALAVCVWEWTDVLCLL